MTLFPRRGLYPEPGLPTFAVARRHSRGCAFSARLHTRRLSNLWRGHCLSRSKTRPPRASCASSTNAAARRRRRAWPKFGGLASPPPSRRGGKAPPLPWVPPLFPLPCLLLPRTSARRHPVAARPEPRYRSLASCYITLAGDHAVLMLQKL
jgi:hypothetical protein